MAKPEKHLPAKQCEGSPKQVSSEPRLLLNSNPIPKIKELGGGNDDRWNNRVVTALIGSLPSHSAEQINDIANATASGLLHINPSDPIEGMLAAQMISAHETALSLRRRAWHPEQDFIVKAKFLELADKATRTLAMLAEALD